MYGICPRCYEAEPSNPKGIPYTTASEESMWLVPQLTAFHQSQAEKSIPLGNTFGFRQLREQRLEKCGLCPITLHFSRPLIGGRQATVVQFYIYIYIYIYIYSYIYAFWLVNLWPLLKCIVDLILIVVIRMIGSSLFFQLLLTVWYIHDWNCSL